MQELKRWTALWLIAVTVAAAQVPATRNLATTRNPDDRRVSWRMRTTVGHKDLLQWRVGIPATAFRDLTFLEAAARADALGLSYIEGFSSQKAAPDIPKNLDFHLSAEERKTVVNRLRELNIRMVVYHVDAKGSDEQSRAAEFAKELGADTIVPSSDPAADRRKVLTFRDHSVADMTKVLGDLYRSGAKPVFIALDTKATDTFAGLSRVVDDFEKAVQPILGEHVNQISRNTPITPTDKIPAELRQKIEAAIPKQAIVQPKKPRKLLILDICVANYVHASIPWGNLMLELIAKNTGAYQPTFSNDLNNLKYDKIREFDAIFLNDTVGEIFVDQNVRDGLIRFVREGGGLGALHGASYASRNWPEFGEMLGAVDAPHRIEPGTLKLDDPASPITAALKGKPLEYTDEFYRFYAAGPTARFSRDKVHVLLSIDVEKTDMVGAKPLYMRPDNDYALAWIKSYGKGRVFFNAMGHTSTVYTTPQLVEHILAGIQFALGDLPADTTPSSKLAKAQKGSQQ